MMDPKCALASLHLLLCLAMNGFINDLIANNASILLHCDDNIFLFFNVKWIIIANKLIKHLLHIQK